MILRIFGARVDQDVHVYPTTKITMPWNISFGKGCAVGDGVRLYALGEITIGKRTTLSQGCHVCAGSHDITKLDRPLIKPPITIGDDVWLAADVFVGPDVKIGAGTIVGARSVVMRDIGARKLVIGNPAMILKTLECEAPDDRT